MRRVDVDADAIVPREVRARYASLPSTVSVRGRDVEIHYDVEESPDGTGRRRASSASGEDRAHARREKSCRRSIVRCGSS